MQVQTDVFVLKPDVAGLKFLYGKVCIRVKKFLSQSGAILLALLCFWLAGCGDPTATPDNTSIPSPTPQHDELTATTPPPILEIPTPGPADQIIQIRIDSIKDGVEGAWSESFDVPMFSGGNNAENVSNLNEDVQAMLASYRIDDAFKAASFDSPYAGEYFSECSVSILENGNEFKTLAFAWYWHMGTPHPYSELIYLTFDAFSGEVLPIDHFVRDVPDYKNKIDNYLVQKCRQAEAENEGMHLAKENARLKWDGTDNYYYDKAHNAITIEYGDYSLSDYATHFTTIKIRLAYLTEGAGLADKIQGLWYFDTAYCDEGAAAGDYMNYLYESHSRVAYLRFDDGVFYSGSYEFDGETSGHYVWHEEGTYSVAGSSTIRLFLNNENHDPVLFWRNGQEEVAYLNTDTETLRYVTDWSASEKRTVNLIFR